MRSVELKTWKLAAVILAFGSVGWVTPHEPTVLRTLVIGGGPDQEHNQVAIESNVRYLARILPANAPMRVLFADGDLKSENVQCQDDAGKIYYRAPELPRLDGPAKTPNVKAELDRLAEQVGTSSSPVLLYFTGHGSPNRPSEYNNNQFDLWGGDDFSVSDVAHSLAKFPKGAPVTLVMVQCFSGAFGNVLFENGDPTAPLVEQRVCGFFAAVPQRMAAGCTPQIREADYKDFSGYFFSALTGVDRLGKTISGADFNHDGKVGMNEAFDFSLLYDDSIDTPVCTSDTFLRRFVTTPDAKVFETSYAKTRSWASSGQLAALDGLSDLLGLQGDDRLATAFDEFNRIDPNSEDLRDVRLIRFARLAKSIILAHTLNTTGDRKLKARYTNLLQLESRNPLRD
ncbi:MAG TPA: hypothetical protein VMI31_18815 [Fimbriimonadaceae bacterium]|nr:hypothetical protein [Fimbriimonadaceae bacterium]